MSQYLQLMISFSFCLLILALWKLRNHGDEQHRKQAAGLAFASWLMMAGAVRHLERQAEYEIKKLTHNRSGIDGLPIADFEMQTADAGGIGGSEGASEITVRTPGGIVLSRVSHKSGSMFGTAERIRCGCCGSRCTCGKSGCGDDCSARQGGGFTSVQDGTPRKRLSL